MPQSTRNLPRLARTLKGMGASLAARSRVLAFGGPRPVRKVRPEAERLESLQLLTCSTISGFVYNDFNNNGLYQQPVETPVAGSTIELRDGSGALVATTTTAADGSYNFMTDPRIATTPQDLLRSVSQPLIDTDFNRTLSLPQFDPSLGTLVSVHVQSRTTIQSRVRAENLGPVEQSGVTAQVRGTVGLTAPGIPVGALQSNLIINVGPATLQPNDGSNPTITIGGVVIILPDFSGPDTRDFGSQEASDSLDSVLTDPAVLAAYTGTGQVAINVSASATNGNSGNANVAFDFATHAGADATMATRISARSTPFSLNRFILAGPK